MSYWLERHREAIVVGLLTSLVFSILLGIALLKLKSPSSAPIVISSLDPLPTVARAPTQTPVPVLVYVSGAVVRPGVYALPWDSRLQDAISAAGGPSANADLLRVNLAERVRDEQQVYVPRQGEVVLPALPTPGPNVATLGQLTTAGRRININTATASELESLPGIGPTLAQRIVEYRQANGLFGRREDIKKVRGIGEGIFSQIKDYIVVE